MSHTSSGRATAARPSRTAAASLIGERWVLTAAHCVTDDDGNFYSNAVNRISIGWYDLTKIPPDGYTFADVYYIGDYSPGVNRSNDWALLRLASPVVNWPAIRFANATEAPQAAPGTPAAIVGWGATSEGGDGSDILLEAAVPILADQVCTSHYAGDFIARVMLCAGYLPGGIDTCQGDSGGPIFINDGFDLPLQVGIVSFGDGCARADIPGVYVRASGVAQDLVATMKADGVAPVDGPTATAGTITNQVRGRATVRITADANGLATAAVVEFGGSRNLGSFVSGYVGASQQQQLELRLRNLKPGKKYFYRTTVMSGAGAQTGPLRSFVAVGSDSKAPTVRGDRERRERGVDHPPLLHDLRQRQRADEGEDHRLPHRRARDCGSADEPVAVGSGHQVLVQLARERLAGPLPLLRGRLRHERQRERAELRSRPGQVAGFDAALSRARVSSRPSSSIDSKSPGDTLEPVIAMRMGWSACRGLSPSRSQRSRRSCSIRIAVHGCVTASAIPAGSRTDAAPSRSAGSGSTGPKKKPANCGNSPSVAIFSWQSGRPGGSCPRSPGKPISAR